MRIPYVLATGFVALFATNLSIASAAPPAGQSKPQVQIVWPPNNGVVPSNQVIIKVQTSHFQPGAQGHIDYELDSLANFVASRDATVSLQHGWTYVPPGQHTVIVYLANNQNGQIPGTQVARVHITVTQATGVTTMPTAGGAAGSNSGIPLLPGLFVGCVALLCGVRTLRRPL